jgi:hypothetical protein
LVHVKYVSEMPRGIIWGFYIYILRAGSLRGSFTPCRYGTVEVVVSQRSR